MSVNMSIARRRQINSSINKNSGSVMSFKGIAPAFDGIFACNFSYGGPTSVSVFKP